jgi:molybdenum cofactor cytidylyltransferase
MPVDPGNLMLVGGISCDAGAGRAGLRALAEGKRLRLGADAAARRPAGDARADITGMGVGGLLMEIVTRPQPREGEPAGRRRKVAAIVLAAGRSTRMGGPNKLLARIDGVPLVRHAAEAALGAGLAEVVVVTGHQQEAVRARARRPRPRLRPTIRTLPRACRHR